jgi:hypothetical protein
MNRLPVIAALIAFAATLGALGDARATDYLNNPTPACRTMRNSVAGAPFPPEPNREETRKALATWGGDPSYLNPYLAFGFGITVTLY